jgi:hypothetical protein
VENLKVGCRLPEDDEKLDLPRRGERFELRTFHTGDSMSGGRLGLVATAVTVLLAAGSARACPIGNAPTGKHRPTALWVGDSYTEGAGSTRPPVTGEAFRVSRVLDWKVHLDAIGGTGFVASSSYGPPIPTRLVSDKGRFEHPNYIVIDGGRNDHGSESVEAHAVKDYFDAIARDYPAARVIVIAPWLMTSKPTAYAATRCLVENQAIGHGWTYVDPLALGWVDSKSAALVASDGVHPNDAGYSYLASHLVYAMVRALSMPPPIAPAACALGAEPTGVGDPPGTAP